MFVMNRFGIVALLCVGCLVPVACGDGSAAGNNNQNSSGSIRDTTFHLHISTRDWSQPAGIGGPIGSYVPDFLLDITAVGNGTIQVLGAVVAENEDEDADPTQDMCRPTFDFGTGTLNGRTFSIGPVDIPLLVDEYEVTLHDLVITGTVTPDSTAFEAGTFTGVLDARDFQGFFNTDTQGVCELLETIGAGCEACPFDDSDTCLTIVAEELEADEIAELAVTPVTAAQAQANCSTTTTVACELDDKLEVYDENQVYVGYTLYAPIQSHTTYLIDICGNVVKTWQSNYKPGQAVYLLDNGHLLRTGNSGNQRFPGGGAGGIVEEFDTEGNVVWTYTYSTNEVCSHHDIEPLPNGNILMIAWESKTAAEAIAAGRDPSTVDSGGLMPDHLIEVQPSGSSGGTIVWEWHAWDHLVQDYDASQDNYGVVADHPELLNINFVSGAATPPGGPGGGGGGGGNADIHHINAIDYNAELDQILLSFHTTSEILIIDHSTTTAEATGHTGGNSGMGGDILYRWGNPRVYDSGTTADQQLYGQHNAHWIPDGLNGAGNILLFNNGTGRQPQYSSVDEIVPPDPTGYLYPLISTTYGPTEAMWVYTKPTPQDMFSATISGAQRQPNGNTVICDGNDGVFFEVTDAGDIVWQYFPDRGSSFRAERYAPTHPGIVALGL